MAIRPTKQEQHSEEIRTKILDTASDMFRKHGYDKVSVRDIAAELGVTTGTLYHHFKNKQQLFFEIGRRKNNFMEDRLEKFQCSNTPLEDLVDFLSETMTQRVIDDGYEFTRYRVLHSMQIGGKKGRFDFCVEALLKRAAELGLLVENCDTERSAEDFIWLYRGVVYRYCVTDPPIDLKKEMRHILEACINGIKA